MCSTNVYRFVLFILFKNQYEKMERVIELDLHNSEIINPHLQEANFCFLLSYG